MEVRNIMAETLAHRFTEFLLESNALKFGDFTLKSGRKSPYFINAGTAVREVIPKLKAEANVEVVGLVLSVDRMEKTKDSDMSAVKAVEAEFGFPVLSIANVREIFDAAAKMKNPDGTPLLSHDIQQRAAAYLEEYGA